LPETSTSKNFHWIVLFFSMAASAGIAIWLGQDVSFDLLNYHYYSGFEFLHKPFGYDFAAAQVQSFHNPLLHVLSYLALSSLPSKIAAASLAALQGLNFYLVFQISQTLFSGLKNPYRTMLSLGNVAAGFYGIASRTEFGTTLGDNMVSILVLAGLWILLRHFPGSGIAAGSPAVPAVFAGVLIGAASGLKMTTAIYVLAVALSAALVFSRERRFRSFLIPLCGGLILGFLAAYAFWGYNLYSHYGNPFFPYLNKIFHSPYYDFENFRDARFLPRNWIQVFFYPFLFVQKNRLTAEIEFRDIRLALCYIAVVVLSGIYLFRLIRYPRKGKSGSRAGSHDFRLAFLLLFFLISYVIWQQQSSIYRYLAVLELLTPVFLARVVSELVRSRPRMFWSSMALNLALVAAAVPIQFQRQKFDDNFLRLRIPQIHELDQSVILLTGYAPTAFIVPSFPEKTRFVRVSSTYSAPGRNAFVDEKIRKLLDFYDARHTFAYVADIEEIGLARLDTSFYGKTIDFHSCSDLRSGERNRGYLCRMAGGGIQNGENFVVKLSLPHRFQKIDIVQLNARAADSYMDCILPGIDADSVDILYTLNGEIMPPARNWPLESRSHVRLGPMNRSGNYGIVGIRYPGSPEPDLWMPVKGSVRINLK